MKRRDFTPQQIEFVREGIAELPTRRLAEAFTERFGEPIGQTELRRLMARNGIENPRKEFSQLPIGYERYSPYYDCMVVKVDDVSVSGIKKEDYAKHRQNNWKLKQNLVWEKHTGKTLPWRHIVVFIDGDRMNYNPENLYAVPLNVAGTIEKMKMHSENAQIYKTSLVWGELYYQLKKEGAL